MRLSVSNIRIRIRSGHSPADDFDRLLKKAGAKDYIIIKRSLDARKKNMPAYVYITSINCGGNADVADRLEARIRATLPDAQISRMDSVDMPIGAEADLHPSRRIRTGIYPVIIAGMGPAGIFSALRLVECGTPVILLEMGKEVSERDSDIERFTADGLFDSRSNVNFGEGGAGTYSDGKLMTRTNDGETSEIYRLLVRFGAPDDILYDSQPHVGSDTLREILPRIRKYLVEHGVEIRFSTELMDFEKAGPGRIIVRTKTQMKTHMKTLVSSSSHVGKRDASEEATAHSERVARYDEIEGSALILATGHSATDLYALLVRRGFRLEPKGFALGFRVEHPREFIDRSQYGQHAPFDQLPAATYRLAKKIDDSHSVYSFCMCPGGVILPSNSSENEIVTNGASRRSRDGRFSNAAIVSSVNPEDFVGFGTGALEAIRGLAGVNDTELPYFENISENAESSGTGKFAGIFGGIAVQKVLEIGARKLGASLRAPAQKCVDLCFGKTGRIGSTGLSSTYCHGTYDAPLLSFLPERFRSFFVDGMLHFDRCIPGFIANGVAVGFETRTSSPIKVARGENGRLVSVNGNSSIPVWFAGEGSGWAGGITTSAVDGWRTAGIVSAQLEGDNES